MHMGFMASNLLLAQEIEVLVRHHYYKLKATAVKHAVRHLREETEKQTR
jgi:hypothetical protein